MAARRLTPRRTALLGGLTFLVMLPETLPVPVLRDLVVTRFGVSDGLATLFLVANMIGALLGEQPQELSAPPDPVALKARHDAKHGEAHSAHDGHLGHAASRPLARGRMRTAA